MFKLVIQGHWLTTCTADHYSEGSPGTHHIALSKPHVLVALEDLTVEPFKGRLTFRIVRSKARDGLHTHGHSEGLMAEQLHDDALQCVVVPPMKDRIR